MNLPRREGGEGQCHSKLGPPSEIDASLGSSLIYAFITVNNASPFTSGLSCRSPPASCSLRVYLARRSSRSHIPREPFHRARKAPRFSESSAVSQMYFKTTRRRIYSTYSLLSSPSHICADSPPLPFLTGSKYPPFPLSFSLSRCSNKY